MKWNPIGLPSLEGGGWPYMEANPLQAGPSWAVRHISH